MPQEFQPFDDDRYLVIDDTDEDVTQILTVICDRGFRPSLSERDLAGGAS